MSCEFQKFNSEKRWDLDLTLQKHYHTYNTQNQ